MQSLDDCPIIGGGLAGCGPPAGRVAGVPVTLHEMRPVRPTACTRPSASRSSSAPIPSARQTRQRGRSPQGRNARSARSSCARAEDSRVPAGAALAVDRSASRRPSRERWPSSAHCRCARRSDGDPRVQRSAAGIVCTGPLTSDRCLRTSRGWSRRTSVLLRPIIPIVLAEPSTDRRSPCVAMGRSLKVTV